MLREQAGGATHRFFNQHGIQLHTISLELKTRRLKVLDAKGFPIMRHWYVVHRKDKRLSTVAQAFKGFLLTEAKQILG